MTFRIVPNLKFSIVIINYNYGRFLGETISSALAINGVDREIIVVDDGSTDNSAGVIAGFGDKIIPVFKTNGGALSCVNVGFCRSSGDIIVFLDADDRISCNVARLVLSVWNQGVAKVQYLANVIDANGASLGRVQPIFTKLLTQADIRQSLRNTANYLWSACSANAYARWYLARILPLPVSYTAHKNAPDDLLNPTAPLYGEVVTLQVPLCDYRHHGANDSALLQFDTNNALLQFDTNNIVRMVLRDRERLDFVSKRAVQRGIHISSDALLNCPYHMMTCVVIKKYLPESCPYDLTILKITLYAVLATVRYRCIGVSQKLVTIAWVLCLALAPERIVQRLIAIRYVPSSRPKWAARLISLLRIKGEGGGAGVPEI